MRTVMEDGKKYHVKCEGRVIDGVCTRCGRNEKSKLGSFLHSDEPWRLKKKDPSSSSQEEYKKFLRERFR